MRCDSHVHQRHSGRCTILVTRTVNRESFEDSAAVYKKRKSVRENPATLAIAAFGWMAPSILLGNYARESVFSRWWMARYLRTRSLRSAASPGAEVTV